MVSNAARCRAAGVAAGVAVFSVGVVDDTVAAVGG